MPAFVRNFVKPSRALERPVLERQLKRRAHVRFKFLEARKTLTDADLEAIFTFLQTIPAVKNRVPEPLPATLPIAAK